MFNTDKDNVYLLQKQYILSELTKKRGKNYGINL